jgi:hypothetical protein
MINYIGYQACGQCVVQIQKVHNQIRYCIKPKHPIPCALMIISDLPTKIKECQNDDVWKQYDWIEEHMPEIIAHRTQWLYDGGSSHDKLLDD